MDIIVTTADFKIAQAPDSLITHGVGSCVVICFYDHTTQIGAMAHCMLPKSPLQSNNFNKYVDSCLDRLFSEVLSRGMQKRNLRVSLIGGAQMFTVLEHSVMNIGQRNIEAAKQWLRAHGLVATLIDVGGTVGRNVSFDLDLGIVLVNKND